MPGARATSMGPDGRPIPPIVDANPASPPHRPKLGQLLLAAGVIDEAQLRAALSEQERWGRPLGVTLVQLGFVDEETLVRTLARQLAVPVVWLRGRTVRRDIVELVPREVAEKHRCLPVLLDERGGRTLLLAMADPADLTGADEVSFLTGLPVKPVLAAPSELDEAIGRHYPSTDEAQGDEPGSFGGELAAEPPELLGVPASVDPAPSTRPQRIVSVEVEAILRALTQLLVEKGVISRDELVDRVSRIEREAGST